LKINSYILTFILTVILGGLTFAQTDSSLVATPDSLAFTPIQTPIENLTDTLLISFVKGSRAYAPDSTLFDIVKIENRTANAYSGELKIEVSKGWKIISSPEIQLNLNAGETYHFPLRISIPDDLKGGYSYVVSAFYKTTNQDFTKNIYITIPRESKWDLELTDQSIYFNTLNNYTDYNYKLSNYGNSEEIIKVDYNVGKLLELSDMDNDGNVVYYVIPAHSDTIITHRIVYKKGLSDYEKERYTNNYRESTVVMQASTDKKTENRRVSVTRLESEFDNHEVLRNYVTPLNVEWQVYNLLTSINPRYNLRVFGRVLFENERTLDYHIAGLSLPFSGSYNNVSLAKNLFYRINYRSRLTNLLVSSNVGNTSLINSYGMGVNFRQDLGKGSFGQVIITKDRFLPIYSAAAIFGMNFTPGLGGRIGLGYYDDQGINQIATSLLLGVNFSIGVHHFDLEGAISYNQFRANNVLPQNEEKTGFSYKARYNVSLPKFQFSLYSLNKSHNYFRNSNNFINNINGAYIFNPKNRLNLVFYHNSYLLDYYPYRFLTTDSWVRNTFGQLLYIRPLTNKLFLNIGPEYQYNYHDIFVLDQNYNKTLENLFYGIYGALVYKLNDFNSISPNIRMGLARTNLDDEFNLIHIKTDLQFAFRFGINYTGKYLRILAYYQRGPLNISDQALLTNNVIPTVESYQFRPYYQRYFFNQRLRFSTFVNYIYLMPSGRSLFNWNVTADAYLDKGWEFGISNNSYSNQYVNNEQALITNKGLNLYARVRKSFDLQQPRVKFYDLTIIYFQDLNGNGVKDKGEPPVPNIKTVIERENLPGEGKGSSSVFVAQYLISDPAGLLQLDNIPNGKYVLGHTKIKNNDNLFFKYGNEQEVILTSNQSIYVPLTESYKIRGSIIIDRDPNSDAGSVDISDIRVSAVTDDGTTYFGLTNEFGGYIIHVAPGKTYVLTINNVLGDSFIIEKDEYIIEMFDVNTVNIDFNFTEQRRGIKMNGENLFDFNLNNSGNQ
jgi:hypothetical protein